MFSSTTSLQGGTLTGRFVRHQITSKHLGGERGVTVRLPDNYDPEHKSYPVVYMHDGQNMFDVRTGFAGQEWHVDEVVADLTRRGRMPDAVLVAIDNGPGRMEDYTHVRGSEGQGGQGKVYEKFLLDEVMPSVESTYSVNPKSRVLLGSSLGGLVTLAIGIANPGVFASWGPMSSSAWWADGQIADAILQADLENGPKPRVWMDMGTEEGQDDSFGARPVDGDKMGSRPEGSNGVQDVRDRTREAATALLKKGWKLDDNLRYHEPLGATHSEHSWSQRLDEVLPWLTKGMSVQSV